jgi:hypothetical protein
MKKPIDELMNKFIEYIDRTNSKKRFARLLETLVRRVHLDAINKHNKGYCLRFAIPENEVNALFGEVDTFNTAEIKAAFVQQWQLPSADLKMYSNPYYHHLLFLTLYGIRERDESITKSSYLLVLYKVWNGRSRGSIQFCDPDTMSYVVSVSMSKKFLPTKYETPLELINDYFAPTIIKKYSAGIKRDSDDTKRIFNAGYARLRQIFKSAKMPNLKTGDVKYTSGLAPLYFVAKEQNLKISTTRVSNSTDDEFTVADTLSSHSFDEHIDTITNFIVMNPHPEYSTEFLDYVARESKIRKEMAIKVLKAYHSNDYISHIHEILELVFKRIQNINKNEICSRTFFQDVIKKNIISSKHTADVVQLKELVNTLLMDMLAKKFERPYDYNAYSETNKSQWRRLVIYGIAYNLQRQMCFIG